MADDSSVKRMALGLFGISYYPNFQHWRLGAIDIDYRKSLLNYKIMLVDYFRSQGFQVDMYLSTYDHPMIEQMLKDYHWGDRPPKLVTVPIITNPQGDLWTKLELGRRSRHKCILALLDLMAQQEVTYDQILLTRYDLLFKRSLNTVLINWETLNLVSILEHDNVVCDNFYLFPARYLVPFKQRLEAQTDYFDYHGFMPLFLQVFPTVHFLTNERTKVEYLQFYKIVNYSAPDPQWS